MGHPTRERALDIAVEFEKKRGKFIRRVDKDPSHGIDILSQDRGIKVRSYHSTGQFVLMGQDDIEACEKCSNFWLYIVHFDEDWKHHHVITLPRKEVLERHKPKNRWEIPFWTSDLK